MGIINKKIYIILLFLNKETFIFPSKLKTIAPNNIGIKDYCNM